MLLGPKNNYFSGPILIPVSYFSSLYSYLLLVFFSSVTARSNKVIFGEELVARGAAGLVPAWLLLLFCSMEGGVRSCSAVRFGAFCFPTWQFTSNSPNGYYTIVESISYYEEETFSNSACFKEIHSGLVLGSTSRLVSGNTGCGYEDEASICCEDCSASFS